MAETLELETILRAIEFLYQRNVYLRIKTPSGKLREPRTDELMHILMVPRMEPCLCEFPQKKN